MLAVTFFTVGCSCNSANTPLHSSNQVIPETGMEHLGSIPNIGNTCYMNAVLQVIKSLYPSIFQGVSNTISIAGKRIIDIIKDDQGTPTREDCQAFLEAIQDSPGLDWKVGNQQQDAEELFTRLFDHLRWPRFVIHDSTASNNPDFILRVPIQLDSLSSQMQSLLDDYFKKVRVEGLSNLQNGIVPVQLIRFNNPTNGTVHKLKNNIMDPFRITINKAYRMEDDEDKHYTLAAFILHMGDSPNSGHYVAYAKREAQWILYNDGHVTNVSNEDVRDAAEQAYLYFYKPQ